MPNSENDDKREQVPTSQQQDDTPSFIAGRYEILSVLGQGGMGSVYKAHDTRLDRTVAIKTILPEKLRGQEASRRFFREAVALARLNHPNILTLFDSGQDGNLHFIVMELGGQDLGSILEALGGPLSLDQARHVGTSICRALEFAHRNGVVHRDLKPGNILLGTAVEPGWGTDIALTAVKVMDFGLARVSGASAITGVSQQLGTPQYMSPEQVLGREADEKSDLYSFGVVLYELCTGVRPFDGADVQSILSQHLSMPPVPPSAFNADIPQALEVLILRLLEKDPSRRPTSPGEVLKSLQGLTETAKTVTSTGGTVVTGSSLGILPARTPLIGREKELDFLKSQYEAVAAGGGGRLILVSGEPGAGKTRLTRELGIYARVRGGMFLEGRYLKEGTIPYGPWIDALQSGIRGLGKDELIEAVGPYGAELAQLFPETIGPLGPLQTAAGLGAVEQRQRVLNGITTLIDFLSSRRPVVILIDDYQWAPGMTVLAHAVRRLVDSKVFLVGAYRDQEFKENADLVRQWAELNKDRLFTPITLNALTEDETARMVAHHFGKGPSLELKDIIQSKTKGNPFFTEEVLRSLAESGAVRPVDGKWEVVDPSKVSIPESMKLAVEERVNRLGEGGKEALTQAAILGQEFSFPVLLAMMAGEEEEVGRWIDRAIESRLLADRSVGRDERFGFTDDQIQQVLYEGISPRQRRRLHLKAGEALEKVFTGRLDAHTEELAHQFSEGNNLEKGADYTYKAGLKAERLYNWSRAMPLYKMANELWEEAGDHLEERARVLESLADTGYKSGIGGDEALAYFEETLAIYEQLGNRRKMANIHSQIGREYGVLESQTASNQEKALEHFDKARTILEELPESTALGWVYLSMHRSLRSLLQFQSSEVFLRKSLEIGEGLRNDPLISNATGLLGVQLAEQGKMVEAKDLLERSWQIASQNNLAIQGDSARALAALVGVLLKNPKEGLAWGAREPDHMTGLSLINVRGYLQQLNAMLGDFAAGDAIFEEQKRILTNMGGSSLSMLDHPHARQYRGEVAVLKGDWKTGEHLLEDALAEFRQGKEHRSSLPTVVWLGKLYLERGDLKRAEEHLVFAFDLLQRGDASLANQLIVLPILCELNVRTGSLDQAKTLLIKAQEVVGPFEGWGGLPGDVYLAEGMVRAAEGRHEESEASFQGAIDTYREFSLPWDEAKTYYEWGCTLAEKEKDQARELLGKALALWEPMGAMPYAEKCRKKLAEIA